MNLCAFLFGEIQIVFVNDVVWEDSQSQSQSHIMNNCQSANLSWCQAPFGAPDQIFITVRELRVSYMGRLLWREGESVVYNYCSFSPAQSFSGPSPAVLVTLFYCLKCEPPQI
jgi:hypothetical protein